MEREVLNKVLEHYSLGDLVDFEYVKEGVSDQNYIVTTSTDAFFLKKHRQSAAARIDAIENAQKFFAQHDVPVICPLSTTSGELHCVYEGWCYVMYPFVSGISYKFGCVPDDCLVSMAKMLARIHLLSKEGIPVVAPDGSAYYMPRKPDQVVQEMNRILDTIASLDTMTEYDQVARDGLMFKKELVLRYAADIDNFSFDDKNLCLCHGDYHSTNMYFDSNARITAVFDFGMCGSMPRLYDLVWSMMLICFSERYFSEERMRQAKMFVRTYHRAYPFSKHDFNQAMDAFFFKTLSTWRENAHYYQNDERNDSRYADSIQGIRHLEQHRKSMVEELCASL